MPEQQPFSGSITEQWFVAEVTCGVTPTSPSWTPIRSTGGVPAVLKDTLQSNELQGSREVIEIRTGNEQVNGEYAVELSQTSHDDFLASAMSSAWVSGGTEAGLSVTVVAAAKTFTRAAGDFTSSIAVGDLVQFPGLSGNNSDPFIVTAVTATVVTGGGITKELTDEATVTTDIDWADKLLTGSATSSFSVLTKLQGSGGTPDRFLLTAGVEFTGFSYDVAVNAMVTGTLPFIGRSQTVSASAPAGSTFNAVGTSKPFSGVDGKISQDGTPFAGVTTITTTNDNAAAAQFELGSTGVDFVERGNAANTFSASAFMRDTATLEKYLNETQVRIDVVVSGVSGAMSFSWPTAFLTSVAPEIGGPASITQAVEGTGLGSSAQSSLIVQRLAP